MDRDRLRRAFLTLLIGAAGAAFVLVGLALYRDWSFLHAARIATESQALERQLQQAKGEIDQLKKDEKKDEKQ